MIRHVLALAALFFSFSNQDYRGKKYGLHEDFYMICLPIIVESYTDIRKAGLLFY